MYQLPIRLISLLIIIFTGITAKAQISIAYNIGSVGNIGSVSPVFSGPVILDNVSCLLSSNGIQKLQLTGNGVFNSDCKLLLANAIEIKLLGYPNPVIRSFFLKTPDNITYADPGEIKIQLISAAGTLLGNYSTNISTLKTGYEIKMNTIIAGIYLVKVFAGNSKVQLIKIFKP